jgi:hypothetical protein
MLLRFVVVWSASNRAGDDCDSMAVWVARAENELVEW